MPTNTCSLQEAVVCHLQLLSRAFAADTFKLQRELLPELVGPLQSSAGGRKTGDQANTPVLCSPMKSSHEAEKVLLFSD